MTTRELSGGFGQAQGFEELQLFGGCGGQTTHRAFTDPGLMVLDAREQIERGAGAGPASTVVAGTISETKPIRLQVADGSARSDRQTHPGLLRDAACGAGVLSQTLCSAISR